MNKKHKTALFLVLVVFGMTGLAFASVPLYRIFCQVTGFGGTPLRADAAPGATAGQIGVRFDANIDRVRQLQDEGVCDGRVAIAGKSYGGYLTGYAIGHSTAFRAAVVMAPVGNIETHFGTSDGGYYADPYYMGSAGRFDRELAKKLSPMACVERATTATLFMQGAEDERCPKCQSEELFVSLMCAGDTPAELVLYPGEDHHFLGEGTPSVREDAARRIIDWTTRHLDREPPPLREGAQAREAAQPDGA